MCSRSPSGCWKGSVLPSASFPKATRGLVPISYRGALLSTLLHATVYVYTQFAECTSTPKATRGLEPISYRGALLSTLLHATVYVYTQFAECTSTDCSQ
jgi:hypothetical protein